MLESDIDLAEPADQPEGDAQRAFATLASGGFYGGSGLAGPLNPSYTPDRIRRLFPTDFAGAFENTFNNSSPDYLVGLNLNIPIRNRVAKADQFRSELEYRQSELRMEQLKKQIRIEVRNAQYALRADRQPGCKPRAKPGTLRSVRSTL